MSKAAELAALIGSQTALSNRNLIINGAMTVAQRSTSETNFTGSAFRTVDRVRSNLNGGGAFDQEQSTDVPSGEGFKNSLKTTVNTVDSSIAAGDYYGLEFPLEGQNINTVSGFGTSGAKNLTLSFFVKSSVTGDYSVSFQNGVFDTSYVSKYTISSANTWEKKTINITAKTDGTWVTTNAQGARIWFSLGTGSTFSTSNEQTYESGNYVNITGTTQWISNAGATFYITGVQLEVGETATPFEHEDYGTTLHKCQRYLYRTSGGGGTNAPNHLIGGQAYNSTTVGQCSAYFPATMRAKPTFSTSGLYAWNNVTYAITSTVANNSSIQVGTVNLGVASGLTTNRGYAILTASNGAGYVEFDAEL
jgi:hypothetical protein